MEFKWLLWGLQPSLNRHSCGSDVKQSLELEGSGSRAGGIDLLRVPEVMWNPTKNKMERTSFTCPQYIRNTVYDNFSPNNDYRTSSMIHPNNIYGRMFQWLGLLKLEDQWPAKTSTTLTTDKKTRKKAKTPPVVLRPGRWVGVVARTPGWAAQVRHSAAFSPSSCSCQFVKSFAPPLFLEFSYLRWSSCRFPTLLIDGGEGKYISVT